MGHLTLIYKDVFYLTTETVSGVEISLFSMSVFKSLLIDISNAPVQINSSQTLFNNLHFTSKVFTKRLYNVEAGGLFSKYKNVTIHYNEPLRQSKRKNTQVAEDTIDLNVLNANTVTRKKSYIVIPARKKPTGYFMEL